MSRIRLRVFGCLGLMALALSARAERQVVVVGDGDITVTNRWDVDVDYARQTCVIYGVDPKPAGDLTVPYAFAGYDGTRAVQISVEAIADGAFADSPGLNSVSIPSSVMTIGDYVFSNCTALSSVTLEYGVRHLGRGLFVNTIIRELTLPDSLLSLGGNPAEGMPFDSTIKISDSSHFATDAQGLLYNRDFTRLYGCPTRTEGSVVVSNSVTEVAAGAFFGCFRLREITLPAAVERIRSKAFNVAGIWPSLGAPEWQLIGETTQPRLESITFLGDRPTVETDVFTGTDLNLTIHAAAADWESYWGKYWYGRLVVSDSGKTSWSYTVDADGSTLVAANGATGKVSIPAMLGGVKLVAIAPTAFANATGITEFVSMNENFTAVGGCLRSADGKRLLRVPDAYRFPYQAITVSTTYSITKTTYPGVKKSAGIDNINQCRTVISTNAPSVKTITVSHAGDTTFDEVLVGVNYIADYAFANCNCFVELGSYSTNGTHGTVGETSSGQIYTRQTTSATTNHTSFVTACTLSDKISTSGYAFARSGIDVTYAGAAGSRYQIAYANLRGATHDNPASYVRGSKVVFTAPSAVTGYRFTGWSPEGVSPEMAGNLYASATWAANTYTVRFEAAGGEGEMASQPFTYGIAKRLYASEFHRYGYEFRGWSRTPGGEVEFADGEEVLNLTDEANVDIYLHAVWARHSVAAPVFATSETQPFARPQCEVTLSCATPGAQIYYAINSTPRVSDAYLYKGPISVSKSCQVRAVAVLEGVKSEYVTLTLEKAVVSLNAALDADSSLVFSYVGGHFEPVSDATAPTGLYSARSPQLEDAPLAGTRNSAGLKLQLKGRGTLSFKWKCDCEEDDSGFKSWDRLAFYAQASDAEPTYAIDGQTDWTLVTYTFDADTTRTVAWFYEKDELGTEGEDCGWLDSVTWTPAVEALPLGELKAGASADDVARMLAGAADARLLKRIVTAEDYAAFRTWALSLKGLTPAEVLANPNAAAGYLLKAQMLPKVALAASDLKPITVASTPDGAIVFTLEIAGLTVGDAVEKAAILEFLSLAGSSELASGSFSADELKVELATSLGGKLQLKVRPAKATDRCFIHFGLR